MKVIHWSLWAPHRSGLFEFVRDQIKYERLAGLDSILCHSDIENPDPVRFTNEGLVAQPWKDALDAEVWVLHRAIPGKFNDQIAKKKSIAILHGTSEIMVLHEIESSGKNDKFNMHVDFMDMFKKIVTITKSDDAIMRLYDNGRNKIVYINDAVDMEHFSIEGYAWPFQYRPAIISTTQIRINKNPAPYFWAMPRVIELMPMARMNIFGLSLAEITTWKNIILRSGKMSTSFENVQGQFFELRPFMRGADISVNSNYSGIFSRDSMESMSCGNSVIAYTNEHTPYVAERSIESIAQTIKRAYDDLLRDPEGQIRKNRAYAEEHFCMQKATKKYIDLYNSLR